MSFDILNIEDLREVLKDFGEQWPSYFKFSYPRASLLAGCHVRVAQFVHKELPELELLLREWSLEEGVEDDVLLTLEELELEQYIYEIGLLWGINVDYETQEISAKLLNELEDYNKELIPPSLLLQPIEETTQIV